MRTAASALLPVLLACLLSACGGESKPADLKAREARIDELETELSALKDKNTELQQQLDDLSQSADGNPTVPASLSALPRSMDEIHEPVSRHEGSESEPHDHTAADQAEAARQAAEDAEAALRH